MALLLSLQSQCCQCQSENRHHQKQANYQTSPNPSEVLSDLAVVNDWSQKVEFRECPFSACQ